MPNHTSTESTEVVSAFQRADHATPAMFIRHGGQSAGHRFKTRFAQIHVGQWIILMRIETGGDQQHFWTKRTERRHDGLIDRCEILIIPARRLETGYSSYIRDRHRYRSPKRTRCRDSRSRDLHAG